METNHIHLYVMTYDTEFAPNPHHGILTLATCKPKIRKYAKVGDWIAGWSAKRVMDKTMKPINFTDGQRLIYIARIKEVISLEDYWKRFPQKRPHLLSTAIAKNSCNSCGGKKIISGLKVWQIYDSGDNIYKPLENGRFEQLANAGEHGEENKKTDLNGKNALVCEEFYYFGAANAIDVRDIFKTVAPRWKKIELENNEVAALIEYIRCNFTKGYLSHKTTGCK